MKELNIEQKARRYDEAIEKAKDYYNKGKVVEFANYVASDIFPELKESEDERIREGIIRNLEYLLDRAEGFVKDELEERIAWLEKQNFNVDNTNKEYLRGYREGKQEILDKYSELEKRCADKPYYTELLGYFHGKRLNHSVEEIRDWLKSKI